MIEITFIAIVILKLTFCLKYLGSVQILFMLELLGTSNKPVGGCDEHLKLHI